VAVAIATYQDVESSLGRSLSTAERDRAEWWLTGAEIQIKARLGDPALLDQTTVRYVEAEAVAARMGNPDNYSSETIDDYTYRYGTETRQVTIRPEWWALLKPGAGAFSARPYFAPDTDANDPGLNWA
jgi:hypothetical protein